MAESAQTYMSTFDNALDGVVGFFLLMLSEISNHDDESDEIIQRVSCHGDQQIGCGIGSDEGGKIKPEKCGQHGVDGCDGVSEAEEEIADQDGQKWIPILNPQIQEASKEGFFADAGQNRQQNNVEPTTLVQIRTDGVSNELADLHKSPGA